MSSCLHGKPRLRKAYGGKERAWHFYQEVRIGEFTWFTRLCDDLNVHHVYGALGKSVRVCGKCLHKATP